MQQQIQCLGFDAKPSLVSRFQEAFRQMWQQNGDHISRIYVGTGALDGKARVGVGSKSQSFILNLF